MLYLEFVLRKSFTANRLTELCSRRSVFCSVSMPDSKNGGCHVSLMSAARVATSGGVTFQAASFRVLNRTETTKLVKSVPRIALFRQFHVF